MTDDTENSDESDNTSTDVLEKLDKLGPNRYEVMAREVENALEAENNTNGNRDTSDTGSESVEEVKTTDGDIGEAETSAEDNDTDDDDHQR
jgi:hypothetical protein